MPVRTATARWDGDLKSGQGRIRTASAVLDDAGYSFTTRFEEGRGTNPEELIGAAHAACYSMALSAGLGKAGHAPRHVETSARVHLEKQGEGFAIKRIELTTEADVPDLDEQAFRQHAETAKTGCPVSKALAGADIQLTARLVGATTA